jgi:hypothetical protein
VASPVADTYSAPSGAAVYAGRYLPSSGGLTGGASLGSMGASGTLSGYVDMTVPSWVPPSGYFADVPMLNTPTDVAPSMYTPGDVNAAFIIWGGSAILRGFSALGAQVYHSAGHESSGGSPNVQMTLVCDFSSLLWSVANLPVAANISSSFNTTTGRAPDGTPYNPHTYLGLQEFPYSWGGGSATLAQFFYAGSSFQNSVNVMDVLQATGGYSLLSTNQSANSQPSKISFSANGGDSSGTYPITVQDDVRQGWWANTGGTVNYTLFISKTGDITQIPALGGNGQDMSMVICPSLDLLIALDGGYDSGSSASTSYRKLYIRNMTTGVVTSSLTLGTVPTLAAGYDGPDLNYHVPGKMGLQWVEELGAIYGMDDTITPAVVVKLTPPGTSPDTNQWTWSTVSLAHWPSDTGGQSTLQVSINNVWSKFRWVPSLHAFTYCVDRFAKPQVVKI